MHIQIETSRNDELQTARHQLERRTRFVLRRLQGTIRQVRIRLFDINGPRGGADKECRLTLRTDAGDTVEVSARACHTQQAIDIALARAQRSLLRLRQRAQRALRNTLPAPWLNAEQA